MSSDRDSVIGFLKKLIDDTTSELIKWGIKQNDIYTDYAVETLMAKIMSDSSVQICETVDCNPRKDLYIVTRRSLPSGERVLIADDSCDPDAEIGKLVADLYNCAFKSAHDVKLPPAIKSVMYDYVVRSYSVIVEQ